MGRRVVLLALFAVLLTVLLVSCAGNEAVDVDYYEPADNTAADNNANTAGEVENEEPMEDADAEEPEVDRPPTPPPPKPTTSPQERIEDWIVDLDWPTTIELGQADVIRLTMVPSESGLVIEAEFADHESTTRHIPIVRPEGYLLTAVAELHATNFKISPQGPQHRELVIGKEETWYWTITPQQGGRQRMSLSLLMEWQALTGQIPQTRQFGSFSHGFEVHVFSIMGMSWSRALTLFVGSFLALVVLVTVVVRRALRGQVIQILRPNPEVHLEPQVGISLSSQEGRLLQTIFREYRRVVVEKEFMSGYSGARTFMTIPVREDQKADARTIIKLSDNASIQREFHNYQRYVKNTLPPTTARIQQQPVTIRNSHLAALRYTFIGMPGETPLSLRLALLQNPDPAWFTRLADAFGPNWWMQRTPYTFRLPQEYDRKLPAHFTLRPTRGNGKLVDGRDNSTQLDISPGDLVQLTNFSVKSVNPQQRKFSLVGKAKDGQAPLRVSYFGNHLPSKLIGKVEVTRQSFFEQVVDGFDLFGLPDPLAKLSTVLDETVQGTRAVIHGDLNLENILIGPGDTLWLIDFSETREGHTLFDFAHLYVEVVAHTLSQQVENPEAYLCGLERGFPLLDTLSEVAGRYLFNQQDISEFNLVAYVSCLGALKYRNLDAESRHLLYLTAAHLSQNL
jgi:hypothetical protein